MTSHPTAAAARVSSLALTLLATRSRRPIWNPSREDDQELVLRGLDVTGDGAVMALGQTAKKNREDGQQWCRLESFLKTLDGSAAANAEEPAPATSRLSANGTNLEAELVSPDCGFSLHIELEKVDLEYLGKKVVNYAVLMNTLTLVQLRGFLSQMRHHEEEHASVTKLSVLGIAMQALMDAFDSFLHLSVAAPVQALNTYNFAVVSMLKFSLFALVEVRYLLLIWRHHHQHVFAEGWETVRQELSRVYAQFYGALIGGLVFIFVASDYLDIVALAMQAYWVPQILHDVRHGSKNSFTRRFIITIAVTRTLEFLYLWGCPAGLFNGDIYPQLPGTQSFQLCAAAVCLQTAQVAVMLSQQRLGPRWFVPWLCLPHVYNYRRTAQADVGTECVICMLEITPEDGSHIVTTPCDHRFHDSCLERWMDVKMECPTCRRILPPM